MPQTASQAALHRDLMSKHAAVAAFDLGNDLVLVARDAAGAVERILVVNHGGIELEPAEALQRLIAARAMAQQQEAQATEHLRELLLELKRNGVPLNLRKLARDTGIARSTLYDWLPDEED